MAYLKLKYNYVPYAYYGDAIDEQPIGYGVLYYSDDDDKDGVWSSDSSCLFAKFINKDLLENKPILYYKNHNIPYFDDTTIYLGTVYEDVLIKLFKRKSGIEVDIKNKNGDKSFKFNYYNDGNKLTLNTLPNGESVLELDNENKLLINKDDEKILSIYTFNNECNEGFGYECEYDSSRLNVNTFVIKDGIKIDIKYELPWTFFNK